MRSDDEAIAPEPEPVEFYPCSECDDGLVIDGECQACGLTF